jgi:hypothetical protein
MGANYKEQYSPEQLEPFFPHEIIKMMIVVLCTLAVLVFMVVLPMLLESVGVEGISHAEAPADPTVTPPHIRPEWYFLPVYQYLKLMPAEIGGMDGKAMGVFTTAIVMVMVVLVPFWFPLRPAQMQRDAWGRGLKSFVVMLGLFIGPTVGVGLVRALLPDAYRDLLHPMYVWPMLGLGAYVVAGLLARAGGFQAGFKWLRLYSMGLWLVWLQFFVIIMILGQGLSWGLPAALAYLIGAILFLITLVPIFGFIIQRIRGTDETSRHILLIALVTEGIMLLIGLMVWAMWPAGGLYSAEHGWHHETRSFVFFLVVISAVVTIFYAFLITERRVVRAVLRPEERDKIQ